MMASSRIPRSQPGVRASLVAFLIGNIDEGEHDAVHHPAQGSIRPNPHEECDAGVVTMNLALYNGQRCQGLADIVFDRLITQTAGDFGNRTPSISLTQVEQLRAGRRERSYAQIVIKEQDRNLSAFEEVLKIAVQSLKRCVFFVEFIVYCLQFLIHGLHFLFRGFQLFVGGLQLFIEGLILFIDGFQVFVRLFCLVESGLQARLDRAKLALNLPAAPAMAIAAECVRLPFRGPRYC